MANRYWVGGNGTWNTSNTAVWSASSGGASGASVPTATDSVFFDQATTYTVNMTGGSIVCLDFTVSAGTVTFASTGGVTFSGSMSLSASTVWSNTGQITFNATTTGKTITTNGVSLGTPAVVFNGVGGSWQLQTAVTVSGSSALVTVTNGTLDLNNKTLTSFYFDSNNTNTRTIAFGTTGSVVITGAATSPTMILALNSTGLTFTGTPTFSFTSSSGVIRYVQGSSFSEAQAPNYNLSGTGSFYFNTSQSIKNLNTTGYTGNISTGLNVSVTCYGSITLSSTTTVGFNGSTALILAGTGSNTIDLNGVNCGTGALTINGVGGSWQLLSAGTVSAITHTNGTLNLNGVTLTTYSYTTAAGTKNITFNGGTLLCTTNNVVWNNAQPTGFTTTAGTGTGTISFNNGSAKTFTGGGSVYNCNLSNTGAALTIAGNNTFRSLASSTSAVTYTFTAGTTTTFTALGFTGAAANLITLGSSSTATYTISQSSGTVSCDYLSVSRSVATGGASFYAGANSTNGGTNTGWSFTAAPAVGTSLNNFFFMF